MKLQVYRQGKSVSFSGVNALSIGKATGNLGGGCAVWSALWLVPPVFRLPPVLWFVVYGGLLYLAFRYLTKEDPSKSLPILEKFTLDTTEDLLSIEAQSGDDAKFWDLPLSSIRGLSIRTLDLVEGLTTEMVPSQDLPFELSFGLAPGFGDGPVTVYCHLVGIRRENDLVQLSGLLGSLLGLPYINVHNRAHKKISLSVLREDLSLEGAAKSIPTVEDAGWVMSTLMGMSGGESVSLEPSASEQSEQSVALEGGQDSWFDSKPQEFAAPVVSADEPYSVAQHVGEAAPRKERHRAKEWPHTGKDEPTRKDKEDLSKGEARHRGKPESSRGRVVGNFIKIAGQPSSQEAAKDLLKQKDVGSELRSMFTSEKSFSPSALAPIPPKKEPVAPTLPETKSEGLDNAAMLVARSLKKESDGVRSISAQQEAAVESVRVGADVWPERVQDTQAPAAFEETFGTQNAQYLDSEWPEWSRFSGKDGKKAQLEWPTWEGRKEK
ncbi:MAG: hypothetical protein H6727_17210 [Myxococcales bacterium]|nr:hypothetical protein [Myxococcales bacterium]